MRTALRKIGNSRGIIIPATLLEATGLGDEVELTVRDNTLVIEAIKTPRAGWFDRYQPETPDDDWAALPLDEDDGEWQW